MIATTDWGDPLDVRYLVPSFLKEFSSHVDVGCGAGYFLTDNSVGIDINADKLKGAKGAIIVADGKYLPLRPCASDTIGLLANVLCNENAEDAKRFVIELEQVTPNILIVDINPLFKQYLHYASKAVIFEYLAKRGYSLTGYGPVRWAFLRHLPLRLRNLIRPLLVTAEISAKCKMWLAYRGVLW